MKYVKNKINYGYTLIELLVVITIISITSIVGIYGFYEFNETQALKLEVQEVEYNLDIYNSKVKNNDIFDYKIVFKRDSLGYYLIKNFSLNDNIGNIEFDSKNYNFSLTPNFSNTGSVWNVKYFKNYKLASTYLLDQKDKLDIKLSGYKNFKLKGYVGGSLVNNIDINYFSKNNLKDNSDIYIYISDINTKEDASGNSLDEISLININNKIKLLDKNGNNINEVFLIFEKNGKQITLKLPNNL